LALADGPLEKPMIGPGLIADHDMQKSSREIRQFADDGRAR